MVDLFIFIMAYSSFSTDRFSSIQTNANNRWYGIHRNLGTTSLGARSSLDETYASNLWVGYSR